MRAGHAHATRPSPRPRPSAKPRARGSAPLPSSRTAAPQALAVSSTLSWCGAPFRHRRRRRRRRRTRPTTPTNPTGSRSRNAKSNAAIPRASTANAAACSLASRPAPEPITRLLQLGAGRSALNRGSSHARAVAPALASPLSGGILGAATPAPLDQADLEEKRSFRSHPCVWPWTTTTDRSLRVATTYTHMPKRGGRDIGGSGEQLVSLCVGGEG